jgi:hypothetical protein
MIIETFPKRSQPSFNHQLSHHCFVEVLRTGICSNSDEKPSIDVLFPHTPLSFLQPRLPFLFRLPRLSLLFCFSRSVGCGFDDAVCGSAADVEDGEVMAASSSTGDSWGGEMC